MKVKPLHNNVLIEPLSKEERGAKTKAGIFIHDTVDKEKPDKGKIIEEGTHDKLVKKRKGLYRQLYELQIGLK